MPDNNRNSQFSVTTSLISMFDENNYQLRLAGLESGMSIAIWVPQVSPDGKMTYPIEQRWSCILNGDTVGSLDWLIKNRVVPDWQAGKNFKYGVPCNRNMTMVIDIVGIDGEIYLRMTRNIDENRQSKDVFQFKFTNTNILSGYDPSTGNFDIDKVPAQFTMFTEVIAAYTAVAYCSAHGAKVGTKFTIQNMYNYLQAIAAKLGAVVNTGYRRNPPLDGGNNTHPNTNSYGSTPQSNGYNGQVQEVASLNELLG